MISLKLLAAKLMELGIMDKAFSGMCREEVEAMITAVLSSVDPDEVPPQGWKKPHLQQNEKTGQVDLIIPHDVHPDYMWWKPDGMCLAFILHELQAPRHIYARYTSRMDDVPF